jgi:hypothetical protein
MQRVPALLGEGRGEGHHSYLRLGSELCQELARIDLRKDQLLVVVDCKATHLEVSKGWLVQVALRSSVKVEVERTRWLRMRKVCCILATEFG